ncbi:MAG: DUF3429 domain-containing protein [Pseudomonadota bacterium]|nr:DUF3429 domain-containing protein [Pseudomonadota bacterium]
MRIPPFTRALGIGGLVPFVVFAGARWLPAGVLWQATAQSLLASYAALILSFLGAIHWGLALKNCPPEREPDALALLWGICPCLIAWLSLMLPPLPCLVVLAAGFVLQWLMDWRRLGVLGAPAWWLRLRSALTVVVLLSLTVAALAPIPR